LKFSLIPCGRPFSGSRYFRQLPPVTNAGYNAEPQDNIENIEFMANCVIYNEPNRAINTPSSPNHLDIFMKLLITGFLLVLGISAVQAQNATTNAVLSAPLGGYLVVFPQTPVTTIRFDGNSEDIAKIVSAPHAGTSLNHDGTAFKGYVRSTSSESYNANVVDYAERENNVAEYQKNLQSGKWTRFVNGR
jgi:hypothetical protein